MTFARPFGLPLSRHLVVTATNREEVGLLLNRGEGGAPMESRRPAECLLLFPCAGVTAHAHT